MERPSNLKDIELSHGTVRWNGDMVTHPCVSITFNEDTMNSVHLTIPEVNLFIKMLEDEAVQAALYGITKGLTVKEEVSE